MEPYLRNLSIVNLQDIAAWLKKHDLKYTEVNVNRWKLLNGIPVSDHKSPVESVSNYLDMSKVNSFDIIEIIAAKLLHVFDKQKFYDWYLEGRFKEYTSDGTLSKEEIVQDIIDFLNTK